MIKEVTSVEIQTPQAGAMTDAAVASADLKPNKQRLMTKQSLSNDLSKQLTKITKLYQLLQQQKLKKPQQMQ